MVSPTGTSAGLADKAVYLSSPLVRGQGCQELVHPPSLQEREVSRLATTLRKAQASGNVAASISAVPWKLTE